VVDILNEGGSVINETQRWQMKGCFHVQMELLLNAWKPVREVEDI